MKAQETYEQQMLDSDRIFNAITSGAFDNYQMAAQAIMAFWAPDERISRSGISHALKRLERFYDNPQTGQAPGERQP